MTVVEEEEVRIGLLLLTERNAFFSLLLLLLLLLVEREKALFLQTSSSKLRDLWLPQKHRVRLRDRETEREIIIF
jgi:hypothetical protein